MKGKGFVEPFAGAQIGVRLRELAHRREEEAHRRVGDLVGQHVRRVGDDDAPARGRLGVDMVVADAAGRENLELREAVEEGVVETFVALARRHAADFVRHLLELRLLLGAREGPIDGEGLVEPIRCLVRKRAGQKNIDRLGH